MAAALIYSARQLRIVRDQFSLDNELARRSLEAQYAANDMVLMSRVIELDRLFVDRPDLRPYFYSGKEMPKYGPPRESVIATAELIVDIAETVSSMIRHQQLGDDDQGAWAAAIADWGLSPAVRWAVKQDRNSGSWDDLTVAMLLTHGRAGKHPLSADEPEGATGHRD